MRGDNPTMSYDEALAERIRGLLAGQDDVAEKKMFGGLAFLISGHLSVSASREGGLLLRCEPSETADLVERPHAGTFVMRGRAMEGWLRVAPEGVQTDEELGEWVTRGVDYARSLPPK